MPLSKEDGCWIYFTILVKNGFDKVDLWNSGPILDRHLCNIPSEFKYKKNSDRRLEDIDPFVSFIEFRERTGLYGTLFQEDAQKVLTLLGLYNPMHSYRLLQVNLSQNTKCLEEVCVKYGNVKFGHEHEGKTIWIKAVVEGLCVGYLMDTMVPVAIPVDYVQSLDYDLSKDPSYIYKSKFNK